MHEIYMNAESLWLTYHLSEMYLLEDVEVCVHKTNGALFTHIFLLK